MSPEDAQFVDRVRQDRELGWAVQCCVDEEELERLLRIIAELSGDDAALSGTST